MYQYSIPFHGSLIFHCLFVHSPGGCLGWFPPFHYSAQGSYECACTCIRTPVPNCCGYKPSNKIARSYGIPPLTFLSHSQAIFHSSRAILHPASKWMRIPGFSWYPCQHIFPLQVCCCCSSHSGCEVVSHRRFHFHFPKTQC